jgi:O-succinylbenzoic acid--CoA ligase
MPGGPLFADALQRCWDEGDAVLPIDLRLAGPALARIVETLRPSVLLDDTGEPSSLHGGEPVEPGDALVVATSGTMGEPKGVVLTHKAVQASARATSAYLGVDPSKDRWLACLPLAHVGGLGVVTRAMLTGTPLEIIPLFTVEKVREATFERGATLVSLVPTTLKRLGNKTASSFRKVVLGGQRPPSERPANVVVTYGMTETGSGVVYDGTALAGVEVSFTGDEIQLRCPMLLRAYRDGTDPKTPDGWYPTGDAGQLDPSGRLVVHGRLDEVVISGGENIWPSQVEEVLKHHSGLREVAVGGAPDPEWGTRLVAYVVPSATNDAKEPARLLAELRELAKAHLAPFAAPREVVVVTSLPRTGIGKLSRARLSTLEGPRAMFG